MKRLRAHSELWEKADPDKKRSFSVIGTVATILISISLFQGVFLIGLNTSILTMKLEISLSVVLAIP